MAVRVIGGDVVGGEARPVSWRPRRYRRLPMLALGALLVAGSTLGFAFWTAQQGERKPVLVAAVDIEAGERVTRAHVKLVPVGADDRLAVLGLDERDLVYGASARRQIPVGTPLSASLLVLPDEVVEPGTAVVGAVLAPGEYPTSLLAPGDQVRLLRVGTDFMRNPTSDGVDPARAKLGTGVVRSVEVADDGFGDELFVSFVVDEEVAILVADAAATADLRVLLLGVSDEGQALTRAEGSGVGEGVGE